VVKSVEAQKLNQKASFMNGEEQWKIRSYSPMALASVSARFAWAAHTCSSVASTLFSMVTRAF
jgi:hypothetical protein